MILSGLVATSATPVHGQAACTGAFTDSTSMRTLDALDRLAAVAPVWDTYSIARHPLLLVADRGEDAGRKDSTCVAVWRAGRGLDVVGVAERPHFSTPLYGMLQAVRGVTPIDGPVRPAPEALSRALLARGVERAVVVAVPLRFETLGRLGEMLGKARADPAMIIADIAVHESFHLHVQMPRWWGEFSPYAWPGWDVQPSRDETRRICYSGSAALAAALAEEIDALIAAFDMLAGGQGKAERQRGVEHARRFVALRGQRRSMQDTLTVTQGTSRIRCDRAEDLLELEEGVPQWVGHASREAAGLATLPSLRGSYAGSQPDQFYRTGPLQLWVMRALVGDQALHAITQSMARAPSPEETLFAHFTAAVSRAGVSDPLRR